VDSAEIALLANSLRGLLASAPRNLDESLADLGWDEVVAADPATATTLLFNEHGRALASTAVLDSIVLPVLGVGDAVCYPSAENGSTPSSTLGRVSGIVLGRPAVEADIVVPVTVSGGVGLAGVAAADLEYVPIAGIDPSLGWLVAHGAAPTDVQPDERWADAVVAAHRALAAELIGVAERALQLAIEHTSSRRQFGAPIAAFQAVRHRLADGEVALSGARALLAAAFADGPDRTMAARAAKAQAGRAHDLISASALQVCGAIGATMEHPLHRYVARGFALDALLDSWSRLVLAIGRQVLRTGDTPRLVEV
jgi:hypothetical protein